MPALSKVSRQAFAIAEHEPGKLSKRNRGLLGMSHEQLHDFASTPEAGLPERKGSLRKAAQEKRGANPGKER